MSRKYRGHYAIETVETKNGLRKRAVYTGQYYSTLLPEDRLNRYKAAFKSISMIAVLVYVGMGFVNNSGSRVIYVILPYAVLFLPVSFMLITSMSFGKTKERLTVPEYEKTFVRMKTAGMGALILAVAGAAGVMVFILTGKGSTPGLEILYLTGYIVIAFLAFLCVQIHGKVSFTKEDIGETQVD